jgi:hypothetical protein
VVGSSAASAQFSGSGEHIPDVVTTIFLMGRRPLLEGDTVEFGAAIETPQQKVSAGDAQGRSAPAGSDRHTANDQARAGL